MPIIQRSILASAMLAAFTIPVFAADAPAINVSGFGTAALTLTDTDDAEFVRSNQMRGAGKSARTSPDSNLGIQASAKVNDWLSFTAQGLVRHYGSEHYGADLTLAFAKFRVNDQITVRVGRLGLPLYMVSDFRSVGYASIMLRPSNEVYSQVAIDTLDGADIIYQRSFDDTTLTAQLSYGPSSTRVNGTGKLKLKESGQLNVTAEHGPFTVRAGHSWAKVTLEGIAPLDGLIDVLNQVGFPQVAKDLDVSDIPGTFSSLGFIYDKDSVVVQSEVALRKTKSRALIESTTSFYTMLGYRVGKFTPYYYFGKTRQDGPRRYAGMPTSGPLAGLTEGVNFSVQAPLQSTHAVGMRWDFYKAAAFKVQLDRVTPKDGTGLFINAKPGFKGPVMVLGAGVDFVF